MNCILLRYGEIGLKSKNTRIRFEKLYTKAIKEALNRNGIKNTTIKNLGGRFVINTKENIINILNKVPGIQSISPATHFSFKDKTNLLKKIKKLASEKVKGKTFAVRIKRIGQHNFTSYQLEKEAGSELYAASNGVNLTNPEITINLEIRDKEAYLFTETIDCLGGLPPTSSGKILTLFSGGIDSPVAAYQMLKRGCAVDFLFINLIEEKSFNDVAKIYNYLISQYAYNYQPKFYLIDGQEIVKEIKDKVSSNLRQIALKIVFYQIGEKFSDILATGEAISQKSSQTLPSLKVISSQTNALVIRPLIGMDKLDITKISREIGTLASSEKIKELCNLADGSVKTAPKESDLAKIPSFTQLIDQAVKEVHIYEGIIETEDEVLPKLNNPLVVDIRPNKEKIKNTKIKIPYPEIMAHLDQFKKSKQYLIICDFGVQSDNLAFALRRKGIKAIGISLKHYLKLQ
ncbi:MAG: tRNA 4-thiouridine(8) synthase ThiI [Nanoarchaeota archaeon]|nr:tRNA 4-thiouridine(8) synthase ThiI [Nanoarchaeota archaeon]MBU1623217.1 tRNA 4-thiouridine(8) synthase ThiI [Nanoarchaeota archaeon]MBU1974487.1 tRNA 4-thiouridine(8) synthase ThiI [Nanoarchaeota archaeon]